MNSSEQDNGNHSPTVDVQHAESERIDLTVEQPGSLFQMPSNGNSVLPSDVKETASKLLGFLEMFPDYVTEAYSEYRKPMTTVGLLVVASLTVAVADGILDRLNSIPLFAPVFELIGLGFSGWFIFRYLLYAESREELKQEIDVVKNRVVGSMQNQLEQGKD